MITHQKVLLCGLVGMDREQHDSTFQLTWTSAHRARQASSCDEGVSGVACVQLLLLSLTRVPCELCGSGDGKETWEER